MPYKAWQARLKYILKQILPPVVADTAKSIQIFFQRGSAATGPPALEVVPDDNHAWSAYQGWSHQSIVETQRRKWPLFLASVEGNRPLGWPHEALLSISGVPIDVGTHNNIMSFGYVLGRVAIEAKRPLRVLDWGGGIGHYYIYARRLYPELDLEYVVKDLSGLCDAGRELLPEVSFLSDDAVALARRYDLVFASSSLQYTRDLYSLLPRLCDAAAGWLMVTRTPFVDQNDDFVVVQRPYRHGYMTEYPARFINRHKFIPFVEAQGFELDREFMLGDRLGVKNAPEQCVYRGYLFKRNKMLARL